MMTELSRSYFSIMNPIKKITSSIVTEFNVSEVFVFDSNLLGKHNGGAALVASRKFAAVRGQGIGLQGQSYAIPTIHGEIMQIKPYGNEFASFKKNHIEYTFLVARVGCGSAGFSDAEIAALFTNCKTLENVSLSQSF